MKRLSPKAHDLYSIGRPSPAERPYASQGISDDEDDWPRTGPRLKRAA